MRKNRKLYIALFLSISFASHMKAQDRKDLPTKDKITINKAAEFSKNNKINEAKSIYSSMDTINRELNIYSKYGLATEFLKEKNTEQAITYLEAIKNTENLAPAKRHDIYHNLGNALYQKKEYQKAIEAFEEALISDPNDDESRYNLVMAQKILEKQKQNQQNQNNQDQDKNNQNKNQDNKNNQDKNKDNKDKNDKNKDKSDKDRQNSDARNQNQNQNNNAPSKEDAERILKEFKQNDEKNRKKIMQKQQQQQKQNNRTKKNW